MSNRPFRAFVSYCHADRAFASALQRRLETYRLPRRLADRVAPLPGQARGRIGPVFRDRADLSAAGDLPAAVREALAASSALVVVASPDAVASIWVAREIALFRELHPQALILVAHRRGTPGEAMPPALLELGAEPLAADFRPEGDGRRLAFLKIVAGLAGLPLDALVQRDAQRQIRRVTAVTLAAAALAVVMAALLVVALRSRAEAEHQRAGAEGLVEFMLTTLREELKGTGRPQVMAKVDARAMEYYGEQGELSGLSDESLELRAQVLHAMGEDDDRRGDVDSALVKFADAHRTTAAILARHPRDGDAIFAHAQSEYWVGYAASRKRDRATATRYWQGYVDQANALAAVEPGNIRSLMEQGYAEGGLCDLEHREKHDLAAAERHCRTAIGFVAAAHAKAPGNRRITQDLANRHGWLGRVLFARKDYAGTAASRYREIALMDPLLAMDAGNSEYLMRRAWPDLGLAVMWIETGHPLQAAELLQKCWAKFAPKLSRQSSDQFWDTGLRMLLVLARAERLAKLPSYPARQSEADALLRKSVALFPERAAHFADVQRTIEKGE
ncbi:MAG: toll/interleukin-1 receptor domain-containing protein [Pseudomonadota bacterium]